MSDMELFLQLLDNKECVDVFHMAPGPLTAQELTVYPADIFERNCVVRLGFDDAGNFLTIWTSKYNDEPGVVLQFVPANDPGDT